MHFNLLGVIGKGAFGKVRAVQHRSTHRLYALKYINKDDCIRMEALKNVFRERNILERLDHPFIVNLRFAFQDDDHMFMALDLMTGGDMRYHLERRKRVGFSEAEIRVWVCELASALDYLHRRFIVHRDLKPDNVLFDELGHVHLTDFNIATQFDPLRPLVSESGTCVYMAPEMFGGRGYLWQVDWWALGIMLYEIVYGRRPFEGDNAEKVKRMIRQDDILYSHIGLNHDAGVSQELISVIQGLLDRDRDRRLCCIPNATVGGEPAAGWEQLRMQPWFFGVNWLDVENKRMEPVFKPPANANNYDQAFELEELLMEEPSLEHKARRKNRKVSREHELIERKFRVFDHLVFEEYRGIVDPVRLTAEEPPPWVKCVDRKEGAGGRELEEDYDPRLSRPYTANTSDMPSSRRSSQYPHTPDADHQPRPGSAGGMAMKALRRISLRRNSHQDAMVQAQLQAALRQHNQSPKTPDSQKSWFGIKGRRSSLERMGDVGDMVVVRQDGYVNGNGSKDANKVQFNGGRVDVDTEVIASW